MYYFTVIVNTLNIGLSAANLRCKVVGSNPDPYVKLTVVPGYHSTKLPHYNQLRVLPNCNGTVHPRWDNLVSSTCCFVNNIQSVLTFCGCM